jgi:hypothetical protein
MDYRTVANLDADEAVLGPARFADKLSRTVDVGQDLVSGAPGAADVGYGSDGAAGGDDLIGFDRVAHGVVPFDKNNLASSA